MPVSLGLAVRRRMDAFRFLAVVVLCKVYMGVALEEREKKEKEARSDA